MATRSPFLAVAVVSLLAAACQGKPAAGPSSPAAEAAKPADKNDRLANRVEDHWRLNLKKIPVDRPMAALVAGDLNADGKTDLAYFGTPDRVVVLTQDDAGTWKNKREFRMADIDAKPWCLAVGDLNHDTLADLIVLGKRATSILFQQKDGTLAAPISVRNTAEEVGLAMVYRTSENLASAIILESKTNINIGDAASEPTCGFSPRRRRAGHLARHRRTVDERRGRESGGRGG